MKMIIRIPNIIGKSDKQLPEMLEWNIILLSSDMLFLNFYSFYRTFDSHVAYSFRPSGFLTVYWNIII